MITLAHKRDQHAAYVLSLCERYSNYKLFGSFLLWRLLVLERAPRDDIAKLMGLPTRKVVNGARRFSERYFKTEPEASISEMRKACERQQRDCMLDALRGSNNLQTAA